MTQLNYFISRLRVGDDLILMGKTPIGIAAFSTVYDVYSSKNYSNPPQSFDSKRARPVVEFVSRRVGRVIGMRGLADSGLVSHGICICAIMLYSFKEFHADGYDVVSVLSARKQRVSLGDLQS